MPCPYGTVHIVGFGHPHDDRHAGPLRNGGRGWPVGPGEGTDGQADRGHGLICITRCQRGKREAQGDFCAGGAPSKRELQSETPPKHPLLGGLS